MRESISISLPAEIRAELDRYSKAQGITRSDAVRAAIQEYFFLRKFRALRASLTPYAEAQGIFTDEDVFRLVS